MGESILVLGGVRSGKSRRAEDLAGATGGPVAYVATAAVDLQDAEMVERVRRHRERRAASWTTWEVPRDLAAVLPGLAAGGGAVVVDSATLWVGNLMLGLGGGPALGDEAILEEVGRVAGLARGSARVVWVSDEVGSGIIPENALARRFADLQGMANQRLAAACDAVHLCVAGLAVRLK